MGEKLITAQLAGPIKLIPMGCDGMPMESRTITGNSEARWIRTSL